MISEEKMRIVINNYFKKECSVNTSIREAFEKGFRIGASKVQTVLNRLSSAQPETCEGCRNLGKWENEVEYGYPSPCTRCKRRVEDNYER